MADQYPPSHHQSHHHHQHYQPPLSPASSTDSRSNSSNERIPHPRNSSSPVKPTIPPTHNIQHSSNPDRQPATTGNTQGFNAGAVYPPYPSSSSSHYPRPSPPPEHQVAYPTAQPGQHPSSSTSWGDYPYQQQHQQHYPPPSHLQKHVHADSPHPPSTWNQPSPPVQPQAPPSGPDDPNAQLDQLDQLADDPPSSGSAAPIPPVPSPPESPPPGSITLTAPNVPYHPRIHYPISSPGSDQPSSRQYSFVSLPGNAMRKRPRRKFDEIERLYACSFPGCTKAYGTLNHLNAHVSMQRHGPKRTPGEFKEMRRAKKQAQREQARAVAASRDHHNEADGEDNGSPVAGPSRSPASSSRTKRKIRINTEPALQVPRIPSLDEAGPSMPEELSRMAQAAQQQRQLEMSRRVSMDDYSLPHGMLDRRGSGGSGDGDTQGEDLTDEPGPSGQRILGPPPTMPSGPMGSTEQPLGLHGAQTTSPPPLIPSGQLPPLSMEPQSQSMQFWQHQQTSSVPAQHPAPISPTTVVAPHVSHLPGPGPAVAGMPLHASSSHHPRQPSWPPTGGYAGSSASQQVAQQSGPPPLVPATTYSTHHQNPLPFPLQSSVSAGQQTQSPPGHMQAPSAAHLQHAIGVPTPSPPRTAQQTPQQFHAHPQQQQYSASPPPATSPMHRLHQGSMLLTPLNPSHRPSYAQDSGRTASTQASTYGQTTIGGPGAGSSTQGLPSVFELENLSRDPLQDQSGSIQQQQHAQQPAAVVQQPATTSWESYQSTSSYSAAGPSHRAQDPYAPPTSLSQAVRYDAPREYYPPTGRSDMYGGRGNVVYGAAVPQSRPEAHPTAYAHPQRSVSYSGPGSDPYMVPGPSQSQRADSAYIPARSESYSAVPSRGDPGAAYGSAPGGRSDPYGAQRGPEQQQQYQTIPPPQGHIPSHPHHPGLHPQHLPSSDPAHPDPRHDPYGRGQPGPSEGPY